MNDREKIIKAIEICYTEGHNCTECPLFDEDECNDMLMRNAMELLKEQEPVEPYVKHDNDGSWYYVCGACHEAIDYKDRFCRHCGRAVKWE